MFVVFEALEEVSKMLSERRGGSARSFEGLYLYPNFPTQFTSNSLSLVYPVDNPLSLIDIVYKFRLDFVYMNLGRRLAFRS